MLKKCQKREREREREEHAYENLKSRLKTPHTGRQPIQTVYQKEIARKPGYCTEWAVLAINTAPLPPALLLYQPTLLGFSGAVRSPVPTCMGALVAAAPAQALGAAASLWCGSGVDTAAPRCDVRAWNSSQRSGRKCCCPQLSPGSFQQQHIYG